MEFPKYAAYNRKAVNFLAITIAPITAAVPLHKNTLALLGGVALHCPAFAWSLERERFPRPLYIPHRPVNRQSKQCDFVRNNVIRSATY